MSILTIKDTDFTRANFSITPNPAKDSLIIHYDCKQAENASIKVFDLNGREVASLFDNECVKKHELRWNIHSTLPNGIYFVTLQTDTVFESIKLILE